MERHQRPQSLETANVLKPPASSVGVLGWLYQNLFSTWYNVLLTFLALALIYWAVTGAVTFAIESAHQEYALAADQYRLNATEDGVFFHVQNFRDRQNAIGMGVHVDYTLNGQPQSTTGTVNIASRESVTDVRLGAPTDSVEILAAKLTFNRWSVIPNNLALFMVGRYPRDQLPRVWMTLYLLAALLGLSAGIWKGLIRQLTLFAAMMAAGLSVLPFEWVVRLWIWGFLATGAIAFALTRVLPLKAVAFWGWILSFPLIIVLIGGLGTEWLPAINTRQWGGIMLTFLLAIVGIVVSFPLGILLALGRRSKFPVISIVCVLYIELIRGVPLITILFMARILMPLFLPAIHIEEVVSAMAGITLFSAAYMAENVRGGLQSIPKGQYEAGYAVGLNGWQSTLLIILPQALRAVIPAIVGQFIALFKDTSLVSIIGLFDFLLIGTTVANNKNWLGLLDEILVFVAVVYWVFTFGMSYVSRRIEATLGVGQR